jgi:ComF family protein
VTTEAASTDGSLHRLERKVKQGAHWLLDLVFPPICGNCGRVDFRFCASCLRELEQVPVTAARREVEALDEVRATGEHCGVLQNALQAFKYQGATGLSEPLAARLIKALLERNWHIDVIVPVPLFADREEERGYNQSTLLSVHVVSAMGIPSRADNLKRVRATSRQAMLSGLERPDNVKDAFEASDDVKGLSVLLIDDVTTTGSTLRECANALRAKGAGTVYGIAVSHAY